MSMSDGRCALADGSYHFHTTGSHWVDGCPEPAAYVWRGIDTSTFPQTPCEKHAAIWRQHWDLEGMAYTITSYRAEARA